MTFGDIFLIGLGLSMDAVAVSVANGLAYPKLSLPKKLSMPISFGLFQGIMPLFGFWAGTLFSDIISRYAGITTFLVLCFIGGKMLWDAFHPSDDHERSLPKFSFGMLMAQAVATSIDAFAVGVSFCAIGINIATAVPIIAVITLICSAIALYAGKVFGEKIGGRAQFIGGILLIFMGVSALF